MSTQLISMLPAVALIVACAFASVSDLRTRRIPDAIPLAVFALALVVQSIAGWQYALESIGIGFAVLVVGTLLFKFGWMGGGDIKLLAAGSALVGPHQAANFLYFSMMAGGLLSLIVIVLKKQIIATLPSLIYRVQSASKDPSSLLQQAQSRSVLPYALAIAAGAVATTFSLHFIPVALRIT